MSLLYPRRLRTVGKVDDRFMSIPWVFNPVQWLDASQLSGYSDGDAVATWPDLTGSGGQAVQATSSQQPQYKTGIINGMPVLRFDGSDDRMVASCGGLLSGDDYTIMAVLALRSVASTGVPFRDTYSGDATCIVAYTSTSSKFYRINATGCSDSFAAGTELGTTPRLITFRKSGADAIAYRDGVQRSAWTTATAKRLSDMVFGDNGASTHIYTQVDFAEFILFDSGLDTDSLSVLHTWLKTKWGIS